MTLNQKLSHLYKNPDTIDLAQKVIGMGGWRGLFDPFSSEWQNGKTLEEKTEIIQLLMQHFTLSSMVLAFKNCYNHRPDIVMAADFALCKYVEYLLLNQKEIVCESVC